MSNLKNLVSFEPGTYVQVDDVMKGFRKIGLVAEGGDMYFDLAEGTVTPFPLYEAINPINVGNALRWALELADQDLSQANKFAALQAKLQEAKLDTLTIARGLHWAFEKREFDFAKVSAAAKEATAAVRESRQMMDKAILRAAA